MFDSSFCVLPLHACISCTGCFQEKLKLQDVLSRMSDISEKLTNSNTVLDADDNVSVDMELHIEVGC